MQDMASSAQEQAKLTLQDLKDIRWRWLRPETALREHDHKELASVFDALLASQTALDDINNVIDELTEGNISESKAIASIIIILARAALLDRGGGDATRQG